METLDPHAEGAADHWAERLCEVVNELDRLERLTGGPIEAYLVANALGWSSVDLAEEVLKTAVELGCAVLDDSERGYRLG